MLNSPGTIDADYRAEIKVILINHGGMPFYINPGDRIAQLVFNELPVIHFTHSLEFKTTTARGEGGFGSTGI